MEERIMQWILTGVIIAFIALEKAYKLFNKPKVKNNPHSYTKIVVRLATLETEVKNIKEDIKEIKDKLKGG